MDFESLKLNLGVRWKLYFYKGVLKEWILGKSLNIYRVEGDCMVVAKFQFYFYQ